MRLTQYHLLPSPSLGVFGELVLIAPVLPFCAFHLWYHFRLLIFDSGIIALFDIEICTSILDLGFVFQCVIHHVWCVGLLYFSLQDGRKWVPSEYRYVLMMLLPSPLLLFAVVVYFDEPCAGGKGRWFWLVVFAKRTGGRELQVLSSCLCI